MKRAILMFLAIATLIAGCSKGEPQAKDVYAYAIWFPEKAKDRILGARVYVGERDLGVIEHPPGIVSPRVSFELTTHEVKVGHTVIGKISANRVIEAGGASAEELARQQARFDEYAYPSFFINAAANTCHRWREVRYEQGGGGYAPEPLFLTAARRLYIFRMPPHYFLRQAAEVIEVEADRGLRRHAG